jgi:hypothetical protein
MQCDQKVTQPILKYLLRAAIEYDSIRLINYISPGELFPWHIKQAGQTPFWLTFGVNACIAEHTGHFWFQFFFTINVCQEWLAWLFNDPVQQTANEMRKLKKNAQFQHTAEILSIATQSLLWRIMYLK